MNAQEKYDYWFDAAKYDLDTAAAMYDSGRWLYVAFACQQAVEKLCKGLYTLYIDDNVPRVHNISYIVNQFSDKLPQTVSGEQYRLFDRLTAFYLKGRYPAFKQKMSEMLNKNEARFLLEQSKEVLSWLQTCKP